MFANRKITNSIERSELQALMDNCSIELVIAADKPHNNKDVTLVSVIRNEKWRLPCFFEHYRRLGITSFIFIDNDSQDGSADFIRAQADATLYHCTSQYSSIARSAWLMRVIKMHGYNQWYLCVDADELAVFDGFETHDINALVALARKGGNTRLRGLLVDMYGRGDWLAHAQLDECEKVINFCCYFDGSPYRCIVGSTRVRVNGGIRRRMFAQAEAEHFPALTKYPLFYAEEGDFMRGGHQMYPVHKNFRSKCVIGLLHYKFSKNDFAKIANALEEKQYYNGSCEYQIYAKWIEQNPDVPLDCAQSLMYRSSNDLVKAGIIDAVDWNNPASTMVSFTSLKDWLSPICRRQLLKILKKR